MMKITLTLIFAGLRWAFTHWRLLLSLGTLPPFPDDWKNSEQVRVFFIAFCRSDASREIVLLTKAKWDDNLRVVLAELAENTTLWKIAWEFAHRVDGEEQAKKKTLRERIRERIRGALPLNVAITAKMEQTEELVAAIKATMLHFEKDSAFLAA